MNSIDAIKQANDNVNHPKHYNQFGMETIDIIGNSMSEEQFKGYLKGNVIKYITRFEYKNGVEDLEKAVWYLNKLKEEVGENSMKRIALEMPDDTKALIIASVIGNTEILLSQQSLDSEDLTDGNTVEITISESKKQEGN